MARSLDAVDQKGGPQTRAQVLRPREIVGVPGVRGRLPMRPGELILTAAEQAKLQALGWKPGDPLPGNIAQLVAQAQQNVEHEIATTKPPQDHPVLVQPDEVDWNDLDVNKRTDLAKHLQDFKGLAEHIERAAQNRETLDELSPGMRAAVLACGGGVEVVDSRDPVKELQQRIDVAEGRKAEPVDESDLADEEAPEPTTTTEPAIPSADRAAYVVALLGDQPYCKEYTVFGAVTFVFRKPTTAASEQLIGQLAKDLRSGQLDNESFYRTAALYRMAICLDSAAWGGRRTAIGTVVDDLLADANVAEPFVAALEQLQRLAPLDREPIWRAARDASRKFNDLTDALDAAAADADFWTAIGI
jgi:hypothetical protein